MNNEELQGWLWALENWKTFAAIVGFFATLAVARHKLAQQASEIKDLKAENVNMNKKFEKIGNTITSLDKQLSDVKSEFTYSQKYTSEQLSSISGDLSEIRRSLMDGAAHG